MVTKNILFLAIIAFISTILVAQDFVEDIDGNQYSTVQIGNQVWMSENLKVTKYNDGTKILYVNDENKWADILKGAYCTPKEDSLEYVNMYGLLYNYYAISCESGLCPGGWKVPNYMDWKMLIEYLGGEKNAGYYMKNFDSGLWEQEVIDEYTNNKFSALPSGGKSRYGEIGEIGYFATWWSSTSYDKNYAWHWGLYPDKSDIRFNPGHKNSGFSVRCIKDDKNNE